MLLVLFVAVGQFDELFSQGQVLVTRVSSLAAHFKETLQHFQELCVMAKVVGKDDSSLENCLVGLKEALAMQKIELKVCPSSSSFSSFFSFLFLLFFFIFFCFLKQSVERKTKIVQALYLGLEDIKQSEEKKEESPTSFIKSLLGASVICVCVCVCARVCVCVRVCVCM